MIIQKRTSEPFPFVVRPSGSFDGNDGRWSTFLISLGVPKQQFRVLVSSSTYDTRVVSPAGCNAQGTPPWLTCSRDRGAESNTGYDSSMSSSVNNTAKASQQLYILKPDLTDYTFGNPPFNSTYSTGANYNLDTLSLASGVDSVQPVSINGSAVAAFVQPSFFLGSLGLGLGSSSISGASVPSILDELFDFGSIPSKAFSYTAGKSYGTLPGSLVLGGYDRSRFSESTADFPFPPPGDLNQPEVVVTNIEVKDTDGTTTSITTTGAVTTKFRALIESTLPFLYLPRTVCDKFEKVFNLQFDNSTQLYRVSDDARTNNQGKNITIVVADLSESGKTRAITLPYSAFDLETNHFIAPGPSAPYFPIRRAIHDDSRNVLGRAFLQEAYLIVDYERRNFTIGNAKTPASAALDIGAIISPNKTLPKKKLTTGAIAGIAVGGAIVLGLAIFAIWFFWRRKQKRTTEPTDDKLERERRNTVETTYSGTTMDTSRPAHNRQVSELSSDSDPARAVGTLQELPEEGTPLELEDKGDHTNWVRNSERLSTQGRGRFFELMGDLPAGFQRSSGPSTPLMHPSTPQRSGSARPSGHRADSGGVSPQSASTSVALEDRSGSGTGPSPVSPRQTPVLRQATPQPSPDENEERAVGL